MSRSEDPRSPRGELRARVLDEPRVGLGQGQELALLAVIVGLMTGVAEVLLWLMHR